MREFLVLFFASTVTAGQLGYVYQSGGQDVTIGGSGFDGESYGNSGSGSFELGGGIGDGSNSGFGGLTSGANAGLFSGSNTRNGLGVSGYHSIPISEYNKEFYTFSAPEEEFNDPIASTQLSNSLKRNLRVIFIKTPENQALTNAALHLAKQASEDRTAIYVLNKQADVGDFANRLQSLKSSKTNKPEVHFVKYRTPEDAARAQHAIQSQYNTLSGPSISSNEGVAPVINFASPAISAYSSKFIGGNSLGASYLPPAFRIK